MHAVAFTGSPGESERMTSAGFKLTVMDPRGWVGSPGEFYWLSTDAYEKATFHLGGSPCLGCDWVEVREPGKDRLR